MDLNETQPDVYSLLTQRKVDCCRFFGDNRALMSMQKMNAATSGTKLEANTKNSLFSDSQTSLNLRFPILLYGVLFWA